MRAIELHELTVRFPQERVPSLKEWAIRAMRAGLDGGDYEALSRVSFEVEAGETVGVVGSNGSGKSTLLRVIAGIVTPVEGYAVTRGTIAPIIELGTGFDSDLTGRENIAFNGALLGRSAADMREASGEIIDFAGLGEFIDSPLRTYSTGMVARLAFSIAIQVHADVILLDEILSTGDMAFRERCEARIARIYKSGATVILVSHDLPSIERLCRRTIWMKKGELVMSGPTADVIEAYRAQNTPAAVQAKT